ncbi:MAG TPA: serine/threonine-protein kinase [Vicinamibacterales bacterium]
MTPEQWSIVSRLFHQALAQPAADREAFLARATDDEAVRREVRLLIEAHEADASFLERPAVRTTGTPAPADRDPATSHASLVGTTVGPYDIQREIGRGGMGVVYLAQDRRLARPVAVKALPDADGADPERRERLRREARAAAALTHPGIATVYALEELEDRLFLVSEYIDGRTLRDELAGGGLPYPQWLTTAIALTDAVAAAHAIGIVHRDLKPENVLRTRTGSIKVLDFGLARASTPWGHELAPTITRSGTLVGTPAYMAPEQVRGGTVDARSDVFALGILLYELATGRHPFGTASLPETFGRILAERPHPFPAGTPLPPAAQAAIMRCLAKEPERRFADAGALAAALRALPATTTGTVPAAEPEIGEYGPGQGVHDGHDAPARARVRRWWVFHQAAVSFFLATLVVPVWTVWDFVEPAPLRLLLRLPLAVLIPVEVSLRLHLCFVARAHPADLDRQRRRARPWLLLSDLGLTAALVGGGAFLMVQDAAPGAMLVGIGIAYAVVFLVVEPATARAAFGSGKTVSPQEAS